MKPTKQSWTMALAIGSFFLGMCARILLFNEIHWGSPSSFVLIVMFICAMVLMIGSGKHLLDIRRQETMENKSDNDDNHQL